MVESQGTYLELKRRIVQDFLERLQPLPAEIQRNFHLMRELDKDSTELRSQLNELEKKYLQRCAKKIQEAPPEADKLTLIEEPETTAEITRLRNLIINKQQEKCHVVDQLQLIVETNVKVLKGNLEMFTAELRESGDYDALIARKGDEVAFKQSVYETHFVLGSVMNYRSDTGTYEVIDVDEESRSYVLPETQVVLLNNGADSQRFKFSKGDEVYAVYPETTSFYPGVICQPPRARAAAGDVPRLAIQFQDDQDDTGLTPVRWVPVNHVFRLQ